MSTVELGPYLAGLVLLVGLYYGSARLGYAVHFAGPVAAIVWLPAGVAVAFLALFGLAFWPGALAGDLLANNYAALPVGGALGQTAGNMVEVLVAAALIRRLLRSEPPRGGVGDVARMVAALAAATLASAVIGPLSLVATGAIDAGTLPTVVRTWWLGDFCGTLVVVPLALAWSRIPRLAAFRNRLPAAAFLVVIVVVVCEIAAHSTEPSLLYLVFPALIWAVLRFGPRGGSLAVVLTVSVTLWTTTQTSGPFVSASVTQRVLSTQLFIAVSAITTLCLAAVVMERELFAVRLGESRERIVRAAEAERRRIERDLHDGAQQRLVALAIRLHLAAETGSEALRSRAAITQLEDELQLAIDELRELSRGLHPTLLARLGLADAVRSLAVRAPLPVIVDELPSVSFPDSVEAAAYFVVSEALTNAHKHAEATSVRIGIHGTRDSLEVSVADDGRGGAWERPGSGLAGLRERVEALGGRLRVENSSRGTRVAASIPTNRITGGTAAGA